MAGRMDPEIMKRFPVVDVEDLPDDLRERIALVSEKSGFIPNVFIGIAQRPAEMRAFFDFHDSLMDRETPGLSKADREMIVVATSAENDCLYCVVAHGAIARIRSKNPYISDQLATDWRKADLDDRQYAVISIAVKLAARPSEIVDADLDLLRTHGLSDEDVYDVGAITAFFSMSNRLVHWSGLMPNKEFYLMGRVPKES
ncbi:alkyl hydroperoxide reductase AhpD [Flexivirga endophytica]|uniref:Alkyl hydroperoxide reductase AhpD n=1 Tax=Flexivirga endophytica TaxID=1849103 RepID=A0A916T8M2_9MICO|nr:peroxidase-related enzyme [Flexivirga endophytica]GGB34522.1 alkyl hydroperoxide reductase AhpD [Flexivirga endophytica]GHB42457.1 alkyl hydroperoxide reductase AhpD [Flexivirga endophytica]